MNLNPTILTHAEFLERSRSRKELNSSVGLIEEKFSVLEERQNTQPAVDMSNWGQPSQPRAVPECPVEFPFS